MNAGAPEAFARALDQQGGRLLQISTDFVFNTQGTPYQPGGSGGDTIAFPKTQQARCLMTSAPGGVADKQLEELHVASTWVEPDQED